MAARDAVGPVDVSNEHVATFRETMFVGLTTQA